MRTWLDNLLEEVEFWKKEAASSGGKYYQHYLERIKPKQFVCDRMKEMKVEEDQVILDVGSGICS